VRRAAERHPGATGRAAAVLACLALACASPPAERPDGREAPPAGREAPAPAALGAADPAAWTLPADDALGPAPARVLLVSVAGLAPRAYRGADGAAPWMPTLARLARAGARADAVVPVAPASPGPVHASLVTGRRPAAHGVGSDHPLAARGTDPARHREAGAIGAPTLWDRVREPGAGTALIGWPSTAGAPADRVFPELFPVRLGETSLALLGEHATPALLETARRLGAERPEAGFPGAARDAVLAGLACEVLAGPEPPRLTLLRLSQTETLLRRVDGELEAEAVRAGFAGADAALARVLACLAGAGRLASTAVIVVGDVPVAPVHTRVQPNVALEAAGLLVPSARSSRGVERWDAYARSNGTSAFVYARDPESAVLARRALDEAADATRAFRVVSAEELLALGVDREAWFGLEAAPGYVFGDGIGGRTLLGPAAVRGAWGGLGVEASTEIGFVAWGAGVRGPLRIPVLRQTDVAPTVARLLGLEWPPGEGRALVGLVRTPPVAVGAGRSDAR